MRVSSTAVLASDAAPRGECSVFALSDVLAGRFDRMQKLLAPKMCTAGKARLTFTTNRRMNNYGSAIFPKLPQLLPGMWREVRNGGDLENTNRGSIGWYIDGSERFTIKRLLAEGASQFAIFPNAAAALYILKPSHPYVGGGHGIRIFSRRSEAERDRPETVQGHGLTREDWVVQPLLTELKMWRLPGSHGLHKFDCRFYAAIVFTGARARPVGFAMRLGFARVAVAPHDPARDPLSAITNISVQERISGYDQRLHMPAIEDDCGVARDVLADLLARAELVRDGSKIGQVLILGLDIMFLDSGETVLIEVNHSPSIELSAPNAETTCGQRFVCGLFGHVIPDVLAGADPTAPRGWDLVYV